jgi:hypothetical protein
MEKGCITKKILLFEQYFYDFYSVLHDILQTEKV